MQNFFPIARHISQAPKFKKDEHMGIQKKSYGHGKVHRCLKKCPIRDSIFSFISLQRMMIIIEFSMLFNWKESRHITI